MKKRWVRKIVIWTGALLVALFLLAFAALQYGVGIALKSLAPNLDIDTDMPAIVTTDKTQAPIPVGGDDSAGEHFDSGDIRPEQDTQQRRIDEPFQMDEEVPQFVDEQASGDEHALRDEHAYSGERHTSGSEEVDADEEDSYSGEITPEKIEQAQQKITLREKTLVATILLKRLDPSDITRFMSMNSMTIDEKREAKQLFLERLNEEEYDELIAIAAKLGLSQGQSYADSLNE